MMLARPCSVVKRLTPPGGCRDGGKAELADFAVDAGLYRRAGDAEDRRSRY